jgi:protein involved in ribonucleotide reduction
MLVRDGKAIELGVIVGVDVGVDGGVGISIGVEVRVGVDIGKFVGRGEEDREIVGLVVSSNKEWDVGFADSGEILEDAKVLGVNVEFGFGECIEDRLSKV